MFNLQNDALARISKITSFMAIALALPAFAIWLGLPPEGDAVDYRVPIIKWMARHGSYPNWPWTYVDDFPMLGELLMLPLYLLKENLMRLVPIAAYIGIAWVCGKIACAISDESKALFWFVFALTLAFRPMAIQSNLLMTDNLASFFALFSVYFVLKKKIGLAGIMVGFAMATRYFVWGASLAMTVALFAGLKDLNLHRRKVFLFIVCGALAPLPFLFRNSILNGDPVFPLLTSKIQGLVLTPFDGSYGRGQALKDFFLLPYDLFYTNTFLRPIFDYSLGALFYAEILLFILATLVSLKSNGAAKSRLKHIAFLGIFSFLYLLTWFFGSQQLRFLVPSLMVLNTCVLAFIFARLPKAALLVLTVFSLFSVASIQKDSILMAMGKKESIFKASIGEFKSCYERAGAPQVVGYVGRTGALGFFDHDFIFTPDHFYGLPGSNIEEAEFIYQPGGLASSKYAQYKPWPLIEPCGVHK